jgi:hypothetical protein
MYFGSLLKLTTLYYSGGVLFCNGFVDGFVTKQHHYVYSYADKENTEYVTHCSWQNRGEIILLPYPRIRPSVTYNEGHPCCYCMSHIYRGCLIRVPFARSTCNTCHLSLTASLAVWSN